MAQTITITQSSSGITATGYDGGAERTWTQSFINFGGKNVMKSSADLQLAANNGFIYNTSAIPGRIKTIMITATGTGRPSTLYVGNTTRLVNSTTADYNIDVSAISLGAKTGTGTWTITPGDDYSFFAIKRGANVAYWSSIEITYESLTPCSGTPAPGNTLAATNPVVSGGTTALSLQNATSGSGVTYQWQQSTTSAVAGFSNITGATSSTYTATVTAKTWYKCTVTCSGNSTDSTPVLVNLKYCDSAGNNSFVTGVTGVSFNTISNLNQTPTKSAGYTDNTSISTTVTAGSIYPLSVYVNTAGNYIVYAKAWIDWNQDSVFDVTEEYNLGSKTNATNGSTSLSPLNITVPSGATLGNTRMRVSARYSISPDKCDNGFDGEVEDYTINVIAASATPVLAITGTTAHGATCPTIAATPQTYTITNTGTGAAAGVTVVSNDAQFVVSALSSTTIAGSGGTATYVVTFTPSSAGAKTATITVASTTTGSNSPTSSLTGTGTATVAPSVTSGPATNITTTTATLNASASTFGVCPTTIEKGFVLSQTSVNPNPLVGGIGVTKGANSTLGSSGPFAINLTGAVPSTGYSYKPYLFDGVTYTYGAVQTFTTLTPPGNDLCSAATALTINAAAISGTMVNATYSTPFTSKNDVWYSFTPTCNGKVTINVGGFTGDIDVALFADCSTTTPLASSSTGATPEILTTGSLTSGLTYYIRVLAYNVAAESSTFTISVNNQMTIFTQPSDTSVGVGSTANFASSIPANATGYQWQVSTDGGGIWTNVSTGTGGTTNSYTTAATTYAMNGYKYKVIISNGTCNTVESVPATLTVTYCSSVPTSNDGNGITNVVMGSANFPVADVTYYNYTTSIPNLTQGASITSSVTFATGYTYDTHIWIDFNDDGVFNNTNEKVFTGESLAPNPTTLDTSFLLDAGATLGQHKMRIGTADSGQVPPNPCYSGGYGVTVDLMINVVAGFACSGTPNAGTGLVNGLASDTGTVGSSITLSATGLSSGSGLTYQWYSSPDGSTWTAITGGTTATYVATSVSTITTTYYQLRTTCTNSGLTNTSSNATFVTTVTYCTPTVTNPNGLYINSVAIVGTMADPPINSSLAGTNGTGYSNFTGLTPLAQQAQGEGVNIKVSCTGTGTNRFLRGRWKAWVDWNGNGDFTDPGEEIYNAGAIVAASANFGLAIPANQPPGNYRMRIRVNNGYSYSAGAYRENLGFDFSPCDPFLDGTGFRDDLNGYGETEDYLIKVVENCSAKITAVTNGSECFVTGGKQVALTATSSEAVAEFRWYTTATGPTYTATLPDGTGKATTFTTPALSTTTTYYVTAKKSAGCESTFRVPVRAEIKPTPEITFTPTTLEICGESAAVKVSATGGNELKYLIPKQTFEDGTLGIFTVQNITANNATINGKVNWQNRTSVYIPSKPNYLTWYPAISSGFGANKFALSTSDINAGQAIDKALLSPINLDSRELLNLTLKFRLYFSRYLTDGTTPTDDYFSVEVSTVNSNDNNNWEEIDKITSDVPNGSNFTEKTYDLSAYLNVQTLRIRLRYHADGWYDGVAVDDIELYGERPLQPTFTYSSFSPIGIFKDALGNIPYDNLPISAVYFKPSPTQIEAYPSWNILATATLANSCNASGTINIANNSKIWNNASTDWNTINWKPNTAVPTADKCVIIKTPVTLDNVTNGLAKNLTVKSTGSLNIAGNLTVTDFVHNEATANDFVIKSDANLIQKNSIAANSGSIRAERTVTGLVYNPAGLKVDYVYWGSPVAGQQTFGPGGFSPGTPPNRFYYYQESNDKFYPTGNTTFVPGRGYAVQAESNKGTAPYTKDYVFTGTPNNGDINFNITRSSNTVSGGITYVHGYNLVSNPYPSNISFDKLYNGNNTLIYNTAWFWTNASYQQYQQGSTYGGNNYAVYNGTGGNHATVPTGVVYSAVIPNGIIKVGQGFLVQNKRAEGTSGLLNFNNSYGPGQDLRVTSSGTFYTKDVVQKNRFWISLLSPSTLVNSQLIGYVQGATDDYEQDYDAEAFDLSSDLFYSVLPTKRLLIQGKSEVFTDVDKVTLGANFFQNGSYTIALENAEGIFNGTQTIYLKDKQDGIITNLSQGSYTFTAMKGDNATRFEIIYKPETVLATDASVKEDLVIYRKDNDFIVKSPAKKITSLDVYDTAGRLIYTAQPKSNEAVIPAEKLLNSVYVVKVNRNGEISTKKILR